VLWFIVGMVVTAVVVTMWLSRWMGREEGLGWVSGGGSRSIDGIVIVSELTTLSAAAFVHGARDVGDAAVTPCVLAEEPARHLYLRRQLDREHLQRDGLKIRAVARRYASGLPSQSVDGEMAKCEEIARSPPGRRA
jgi:hypothetical protein